MTAAVQAKEHDDTMFMMHPRIPFSLIVTISISETITDKPPRTLYSLTSFGRSIIPVLDAMCDWGAGFLDGLDTQPPCCTKKSAGEP